MMARIGNGPRRRWDVLFLAARFLGESWLSSGMLSDVSVREGKGREGKDLASLLGGWKVAGDAQPQPQRFVFPLWVATDTEILNHSEINSKY